MAAITWKCPNCGGGLQFAPQSQDFECEYCMSHFTQAELEKLAAEEGDVLEAAGDGGAYGGTAEKGDGEPGLGAEAGEGVPGAGAGAGASDGSAGVAASDTGASAVVYLCPSCGAEIVTDTTTVATFCFYCHNPIILQGRLDGSFEPDYVLPFAVDKAKAKEIFQQWLKKKKFVPTEFYAPGQIEKLSGVYFPYWLYSCMVDGRLDAQATKLRTWRSGDTQYTETQVYDVSRSGQMKVDHVTRNALKKADKQLIEGVMPFDMKAMKPFSMEYLAGFFAEKRDMEREQFEGDVETEVKEFALGSLRSGILGYNGVNVQSQTARLKNGRWDYALLPVWTLTYKSPIDGQIYYFACNGQTGKVCGKLPMDSGKLWKFFLKIFLPLLAALLVGGYLI